MPHRLVYSAHDYSWSQVLALPRSEEPDGVRGRRSGRGGERGPAAERAMAWLMGAFSKMARSRRLVASSSRRGTPVSSSTLSCSLREMISTAGRGDGTSAVRIAFVMGTEG